tara:strand:- start:88920 stop:89126 length:207 start_codon:yes stop_codon:yes gene_type:complete
MTMSEKEVSIITGTLRGDLYAVWYYIAGNGSHVHPCVRLLFAPFVAYTVLTIGFATILDHLFKGRPEN